MHPPEPDAGGEDLGESPEINDPVKVSLFLLQRREGGERLAFEAEHPVGVVLDDHKVELARHLQKLPAPLGDHRNTRGVLEVGDGVEKLDVEPPFAGFLEGLAGSDRNDTGPVHRGVGYAWPVGGERVERPGVGRTLAKDSVALVEEDLGDEVEPLLGPCRDEDVLLPRRRALRAHDLDYDVLYGFEARRRPILEGLGRVRSDVAGDLTERLLHTHLMHARDCIIKNRSCRLLRYEGYLRDYQRAQAPRGTGNPRTRARAGGSRPARDSGHRTRRSRRREGPRRPRSTRGAGSPGPRRGFRAHGRCVGWVSRGAYKMANAECRQRGSAKDALRRRGPLGQGRLRRGASGG